MDLQLIALGDPAETREFVRGRFEVYRVGPMTLGRASYEPGWRWSEHVGAATGEAWCEVEHVGLVLSGRAMAAMRNGVERVMEPGSSSTCRPATTAGSSETSRTSRCTSWEPRTTRPASPTRPEANIDGDALSSVSEIRRTQVSLEGACIPASSRAGAGLPRVRGQLMHHPTWHTVDACHT